MPIFLTTKALKNFDAIKEYIINEWGEKVGGDFEKKVLNFLALLAKFPELGSMEVFSKNIRGFQLTK
jgi:plasmid stabilization system protein ParE